jgi:hypothetical protein
LAAGVFFAADLLADAFFFVAFFAGAWSASEVAPDFDDGFEAGFLVDALAVDFFVAVADTVVRRLAAAATFLRPDASAAETTTVTPSSLRSLSRALLCVGGIAARSQAVRTSSAVTVPVFLPRSSSSCTSGWLRASTDGFRDVLDDTYDLSTRER